MTTATYISDMIAMSIRNGAGKAVLHCLAVADVTNAEIRAVARNAGVTVRRLRYNADGDTVIYFG